MPSRECYHCKQLIGEGEPHDCWTTTEAALTAELSEDLQDAWQRLRESAVEFGEQRIYASHSSIMFSRRSCYFFVRPKKSFLEVCFFLGRPVNAPQIRRVVRSSKTKLVHIVQVRHRDEVEAPLTEWLQEAYQFSETAAVKGTSAGAGTSAPTKSTRRGPAAVKKARAITNARKTAATGTGTSGASRAAKRPAASTRKSSR